MHEQFARLERMLGTEAVQRLAEARVAVFGVGGVGGYVVEALARGGVGAIDVIDDDTVCMSNINRQILALHSNIGQPKVEAARDRIRSINPDCRVTMHQTFYTPETAGQFDFSQYDYVVDAIDTVTGKISLVMQAQESGTPILCAMGAGNKMDPTAFEVTDLYKTSVCPLAKVMRYELRRRGVKKLKVVYSKEQPVAQQTKLEATEQVSAFRKLPPGSNSFVPPVMGLILAGEVIKDLIGYAQEK